MTKRWARTAARIYTFLIVPMASGLTAGALFVLSLSPAAVKQIAKAAGALSPLVPLLAALVVVIGSIVVALLNGVEARRTERDKRDLANKSFRDHVEARLARVWAVTDEAVGVKPYQPDVIENFIADVEELYWKGETAFAAFTREERNLIEDAINTCRQCNILARDWDAQYNSRSNELPRDAGIQERFSTSMVALEQVFREVFFDWDLAGRIMRTYETTQTYVTALYEQRR
jgi:hypothetical protein